MASGETQVSEFSFVLASRARRLGLVLKEASIALYNFKYNFQVDSDANVISLMLSMCVGKDTLRASGYTLELVWA